jgi:hypothetical protein
MSDLESVASLSFTIARTVGLELLMVPVGLTEVIVSLVLAAPGPTFLNPPALLAPLLPPALLFGVDPSLSRLLRLPMRTYLLATSNSLLFGRFAADSAPDPYTVRNPSPSSGFRPPVPRGNGLSTTQIFSVTQKVTNCLG